MELADFPHPYRSRESISSLKRDFDLKAMKEKAAMEKFGVLKDLASCETEKLYKPVRLSGNGWYIEVWPTRDMKALEIRCAGTVEGDSEMVVRPSSGNVIVVSSRASERDT